MATSQKRSFNLKSEVLQMLPFFMFAFESICATVCFFAYRDKVPTVKSIFAKLLSFNFILAGAMHFSPRLYYWYMSMIFLPFKDFWLYFSGVTMILGGLGILFERFRITAAWILVGTLIAIFPGNIACVFMERPRRLVCGGSTAAALLRLPFQFTFVIWALWYTF